MEEQVIQETPVASSEQPVAETTNTVNIDVSAYEQKIQTLQQRATEAEEKFQGIKGKLDDVYKKQDDQRRKTLEDQGQWKDLWEEANKTAQGKDQQIADLQRQLEELRSSNETAAMKTSALSAISQAGRSMLSRCCVLFKVTSRNQMTAASKCLMVALSKTSMSTLPS